MPGPAGAAEPAGPGIIVRYEEGTPAVERAEVRDDAGVEASRNLLLGRTQLVRPDAGVTRAEAIEALADDPAVSWAEPDVAYEPDAVRPDDPYWEDQWALQNTGDEYESDDVYSPGIPGVDLGVLEGWDTASTSRETITAVIDSGVDLEHPDLAAQIVRNQNEIPGNGRDDDSNGFVDDVNGWDFVDVDADPDDDDGHGTMAAGIIGATTDNRIGMAGISRDASIMPLRVCDGPCRSSRVADAIVYAARNGATVVNLSLGGNDPSRATFEAMKAAPNVLFVTSAGNDGLDVDSTPRYPCSTDQIRAIDVLTWIPSPTPLANVICVAASDHRDRRPAFSNWGATTVDLAAPGTSILTTSTDGSDHFYAYAGGTSFAAPQVAGIASIARSHIPAATAPGIKAGIMGGAEPLRADWVSTPLVQETRATLAGTLALMDPRPPAAPTLVSPADGSKTNEGTVRFVWAVSGSALRYELLLDGNVIAEGDGLGAHPTEVTGGAHTWQVRVTNRLGLNSLSPVRSFGFWPDSIVEIRRMFTRIGKRKIWPYLWVSEPGTVRLTATATFRWRKGDRPKRRVIGRLTAKAHSGGNYPRITLNAAGRRMRKVAPNRKAKLTVEFHPDSPAAPDTASRSFRLGR